MTSARNRLTWRRNPFFITSAGTVSGAKGETIEITITANHHFTDIELGGADAASFGVFGTAVRLLDSSTAGDYAVTATISDDTGRIASKAMVFTVTGGSALPTPVLTSATAVDYRTIQLVYSTDAAYSSYYCVLDGDQNLAILIPANKQVIVAIPSADYDVQIVGQTSGAVRGPLSNTKTVSLPDQGGLQPYPDAYNGTSVVNAAQASYDFASVSIQAADSRRYMVVAIFTQAGTACQHTSLIGSGGITFSKLAEMPAALDTTPHVSLWEAAVALGTTIDLTFTPSAAPGRCAMASWVHGRGAAAAAIGDSSLNPLEVPLTLDAGGLAIAVAAVSSSADVTPTWTNLPIVDFGSAPMDRTVSLNRSGGRRNAALAETVTINMSPSAGTPQRMIGAAFHSGGGGTVASQADKLVDRIGLNVLLNFQNNPIFTPAHWAGTVKPAILDLGVRRIRTGFANGAAAATTTYLTELAAQGVKFNLLMNYITGGAPDLTKITGALNTIENYIGAENILSIESLNEINNPKGWAVGKTQAQVAALATAYQADLYAKVKARPALADAKVLLFSMWGRSTTQVDACVAYRPQGFADICDNHVVHDYTGGRKFTVGGIPLDGGNEGGGDAEVSLQFTMDDQGRLVLNDPAIRPYFTEGGWQQWSYPLTLHCTAVEIGDPDHGGTKSIGIVSPTAAGKYTSRAILDLHNYDIAVLDYFMLFNNPNQRAFYGLNNQEKELNSDNADYGPPYTVRNTYAQTVIKRIIATMSDAGADFTPGALNYAWTGAGVDADLHHGLFQKRNGKFYVLAYYDKGESWKRSAPIGDQNLKVTPQPTFQLSQTVTSIKKMEPLNDSSFSTVASSADHVAIDVNDHLLILEITP